MRALLLLFTFLSFACSGGEATRVKLAVRSVAAPDSTSDLGYAIELTRARLALQDLHFTTAGEEHASPLRRASEWLIPTAHAHPGHATGGVVTGERAGPVLATFGAAPTPLGEATMLVGPYNGANFTFRRGSTEHGLASDDLLVGHSAHLEGSATRDGRSVSFSALIDLDEGTRLIGAPFEFEVREDSREVLELRLLPQGTTAGVTLFDLVDFFALDSDGDGAVKITPGQSEHNVLQRALQSHVFYAVNPNNEETE